jgi:hypothetical protein
VDTVDVYEVSYVKSLEQRVAELETRLESQHPEDTPSFTVDGAQQLSNFAADDLQPMDPMHWQYSFCPPVANHTGTHNLFGPSFFDSSGINPIPAHASVDSVGTLEAAISGHDHELFALEPAMESSHKNDQPLQRLSISHIDTARFLYTYFDLIHPRYPFLDVDECSSAYLYYKRMLVVTDEVQASWYSFLLTLVSISTRFD